MPTFRFTGKVVPIHPPIEIGPLLPFVWEHIETGEREAYEVSFVGADVVVNVTINIELKDEKISAYRNTSLDVARTALNIVCFQHGFGLLLYLDRYMSPEGKEELLIPGDPRLQSLVSMENINMPMMSSLLAADPQLSRPLNDLITAITWPHAPAINCARAVEGLRHHMNPNEGDERGKSWGTFQENLRITRAFRDSITNLSTSPRHGNTAFIPSEDQEAVIMRSWMIMDRYFHFLGRGRKPLDATLFVILDI
jgi:hypothetical protein